MLSAFIETTSAEGGLLLYLLRKNNMWGNKTNILMIVCTTVLYKYVYRNDLHTLSVDTHVRGQIFREFHHGIVYIANQWHIFLLRNCDRHTIAKPNTWNIQNPITVAIKYKSLQIKEWWNDHCFSKDVMMKITTRTKQQKSFPLSYKHPETLIN